VSASKRKPLKNQAKNGMSLGCLRLFFLPFFLAGAGILYFAALRPLYLVLDAQRWIKTPCVIQSSKVASSSDHDGTTYRVDITYRYFCADQAHTSDRYSFVVGSSSGRSGKAAIVDRYPAGTETFCYVNPAAPAEAVIDRSARPEIFLVGAFGLLFAAVGSLGMFFASRLSGTRQPGLRQGQILPSVVDAKTGLPPGLKPKSTPLAKFLGLTVFALVWNGFISVFVYFVFLSHEARQAPFFAKAIVAILALAGIGILVGAFMAFLALFNPRVRLTAQSNLVPLGGELLFSWTVTGRSGVFQKLRFVLEGREEVTYQRGTSTSTESKVFFSSPVFESTEREFLSQGNARIAVPANLMHTLEGRCNKVLWQLKVHGEIARWPDVSDEYPITVLPAPPQF
jgi:hypothetical protein